MKKFLLSLFLASAACMATSAQETVLLDLTTNDGFKQCTQTCLRYDRTSGWSFYSYYSALQLYSYNITDKYYDDFLITPELELKKGSLYRVTTAPCTYKSGTTSNLHIYIGQGEIEEDTFYDSYTELLKIEKFPYTASYNSSSIQDQYIDFTVKEDGNYKIVFRGEDYPMYLYRTKILNFGESTTPAAVEDFTLAPDADGATEVKISFTLPAETMTGQSLEDVDLDYELERDGTKITEGTAKGGTPVNYTDAEVSEGTVTYTLKVKRDDEETAIEASTFVGVETPEAPANIALTGKAGAYKITWDAPTVGIHGALLAPEKLTYKITRIIGDQKQEVAPSISNTEYTDDYSSDVLATLAYEVVAVYGDKESEGVQTETIKIGSINLPVSDSFADATMSEIWEANLLSGSINWEAASASPNAPTDVTPFDGDNGFAYYRSFNATSGSQARLETAPISASSSTNPVVEFMFYHNNGVPTTADKVQVQISVDNGEWTDIDGAAITRADTNNDGNVWKKYAFELKDLIEGCDTYRIGFLAISAYGHNMFIDAVRMFNLADHDIEVVSLSAPEEVIAGNNIELTLRLSNNSGTTVNASEYTVTVETDFPNEVSFENVEIPALTAVDLKVSLPLTAEEAFNLDEYSFKAIIDYADDEVADNNESTTVNVATAFSQFDKPGELTIRVDEEENLNLAWESAIDLTYEPVNIVEDFESFDDETKGEFNGWVSLDFDNSSYAYYINSPEFIVASKKTAPKGNDGKYIGVTLGSNVQQNDWLISPKLNCKEGSTMTFEAMIACKNLSYNYSHTVEILYTEDDTYNREDPDLLLQAFSFSLKKVVSGTYAANELKQDETFYKLTVENIPASAKYVALHFITKTNTSTAMWVDDLKIYENDNNPLLGYHVYERNQGRVNQESLDPSTLTHQVEKNSSTSTRSFYVTAIYPDGESEPTDLVEYTPSTTEIETVTGSEAAIVSVASGIIITGCEGLNATVFAIDGRVVAKAHCSTNTFFALAKGIYVVNVGQTSVKVIVK